MLGFESGLLRLFTGAEVETEDESGFAGINSGELAVMTVIVNVILPNLVLLNLLVCGN